MEKNLYKKADWINNTNVYEVNLRQYTIAGTFTAFARELPRLKDMGVETLWFMPITPISKKNMKGSMGSYYACSDYISVNPEFGSLDEFKQLVTLSHEMGFKVILDWVANHTGWDHVWTIEHPEYYLKDESTGDFKMASGMEDIIELDYKNPAMRNAMINAMEFWVIECDIDGFRADLAFWVELSFWKEARERLESEKTMFWLAEADPIDNPEYMEVFDTAYTWAWMHKTADFNKGDADFNLLKDIISKYDDVCSYGCIPLWFTSNHDENSWNGTEYEKYGAMAKMLAVFSFTRNGMPMIYSGQELPNLKRLEFFEKDVIEWNGKYELHEFYKILLNLHKSNRALRANDTAVITFQLDTGYQDKLIIYLRKSGNYEVLVLLNFSDQQVIYSLRNDLISGIYTDIFSKEIFKISNGDNIELEAWGFRVFER